LHGDFLTFIRRFLLSEFVFSKMHHLDKLKKQNLKKLFLFNTVFNGLARVGLGKKTNIFKHVA